MIGLYYLVLLPGSWLFTTWLIYRLWRQWKPAEAEKETLYRVVGILLFSAWFAGTFWMVAGKKMYWDSKVRDMCAKDGGITVYETVELPADKFSKFGQLIFYKPTLKENSLGDEYLEEFDLKILRLSNPKVSRSSIKIYRKLDNQLLGEQITYRRYGGGIPGPGQPSKFICPEIKRNHQLLKRIFIKENTE